MSAALALLAGPDGFLYEAPILLIHIFLTTKHTFDNFLDLLKVVW